MMCMSMLLLLCFVMFAGCAPASCAKPGNGAAYEFSDAREFSTKAKYRYSKSEPSYWDYYSVEYDITTFEISYENEVSRYNYVSTVIDTLIDVKPIKTKGLMAHSKGIYYIRETNFGVTSECFFDTVYDVCAFRLSGNVLAQLESWLFEEDVEYTDTWICLDNIYSEYIDEYLDLVNHFFDKEIIQMLNSYPQAFSSVDGKYVSQDFNVLKTQLHDWFLIDNFDDNNTSSYHRYVGFNWEITTGNVEVDLASKTNPAITFNLTAYYPYIDKSLRCGGKIKYNNVNNIELDIPEEVISTWQSYDGYYREF